jgi:outer membrane immunogenic protein
MRVNFVRLVVAGLLLPCLGWAASAADLLVKAPLAAPVPVWSWAGFYAGINGGYSLGADPFSQTVLGTASATSSVVTPQGALFGGQVGYNWQIGNIVFGAEGDVDWTGQSGTSCGEVCFENSVPEWDGLGVRHRLDWFATARGRLGWANGDYLFYVTGGAAWAGVHETDTASMEIVPGWAEDFNNTVAGWAAGAGIDVHIAGNLTGRLEYLHLGLGNTTNSGVFATECVPPVCAGLGPFSTTSSIHDDIVRAGLNYAFFPAAPVVLPTAGPVPADRWTGFHAGINGGYGFAGDPFSQSVARPTGAITFFSFAPAYVAPQGAIFGGQAGYDWQTGNIVLGVEGDAQWADQHGVSCGISCAAAPLAAADTYTTVDQKLDWFATLRGRIGWANDGYLIYGTGGAAFGGLTETDALPALPAAVTVDQTRSGWTAGAGIEATLWGRWSGKLEYLHLDLGSASSALNFLDLAGPATLTTTTAFRDNIVRLGLNYKLGG